jgi:hypothetical protein
MRPHEDGIESGNCSFRLITAGFPGLEIRICRTMGLSDRVSHKRTAGPKRVFLTT